MKRIILASVSAIALFSATGAMAAAGDNNKSVVTQSGALNTVSVGQTGATNDSNVNQTGSEGKATVTQVTEEKFAGFRTRGSGGVDVPAGAGDFVRSNFSDVQQNGASTVNSYQKGDLNRSRVGQSGAGSDAKLDQQGLFNNSEIYQSGASIADVGQGGTYGDNNSIVSQSGGGKVTVRQSADRTDPTLYPSNDSFAYQESKSDALITQIGQQNVSQTYQFSGSDGATASVYQENTADAPGTNNALTYQVSRSSALTEQQGQGNTARTYQLAGSDRSDSKIYQRSSDNSATVLQYTPDNSSFVLQTGAGGNAVTVTQN